MSDPTDTITDLRQSQWPHAARQRIRELEAQVTALLAELAEEKRLSLQNFVDMREEIAGWKAEVEHWKRQAALQATE
jgi:hypothetical protein